MDIIILCAQQIPDYTSEVIGIVGTLLGTILGWLLSLITNNIGKIFVYSDSFDEQRSSNEEYAYIVKLFIYNNSPKQQCMRNIKVAFAKNRWKTIFESTPSEGVCDFDTIRIHSKNKVGMLTIASNSQCQFFLSDLISSEHYTKLSDVKRLYLIYNDKNNRRRKILIKTNFTINDVETIKSHTFL